MKVHNINFSISSEGISQRNGSSLLRLSAPCASRIVVVRFHFRKKLAQFGEISGVLACASPFVILCGVHLAQSCWNFTSMKQAVHRDFERACHLFKGLDSWNCMTIFNARDVASQESCSLFDVAL